MATAEEQRTAGDHLAAARSYSAAYRSLPTKGRAGPMGEFVLENMVEQYNKAHDQHPGKMELFNEPVGVLEDFFAISERTSNSENTNSSSYTRLAGELVRLKDVIQENRTTPDSKPDLESSDTPETMINAADQATPVGQADLYNDATPADRASRDNQTTSPSEVSPHAPRPPTGRNNPDMLPITNTAILAAGIVAIIGGAITIGWGSWRLGEVGRRENMYLSAIEGHTFTEEELADYLYDVSEWEDRQRGSATGVVAGGSVVAGVGIGLTIWGTIRSRRRSRSATKDAYSLSPSFSQTRVGLDLTVNF